MTNPDTAGPSAEAAAATRPSDSAKLYPLRDTNTMLRRNIKNQFRDKGAVFAIIGIPVLFLLLFVYVFGGALEGAVVSVGADNYVDYVVPGLIIMTAATQLIGTSTFASIDMTAGIINRFRTMAIFRPSILIARVVASVLQALASMAFVFGLAFLMGLSPNATLVEWIAVVGLLAYISFSLCWLGLAFGLAANSVGSASNGPFPLVLLPLVGSGIVPTDSMSTGVRYFAEYQPFTPMIDALRGLLFGNSIGNSALIALAWCTGIGVLGLFWSIKAFERERTT